MSALNTLKIRVVLQGSAKFRDGRKWKKRFCLLALSPRTPDAMHFYVTKSYDEFTSYRNHGCMIDVQPSSRTRFSRDTASDCSGNASHSCGYVETGLDCLLGTRTNNIESLTAPTGPVINTAAETCASIAKATADGLSAATSLASSLNGPAPLDEITGFESGYHMDKESNIIVLLGNASAYVIALEGTDEMFRWADTMSHIVTDSRFRVTLRSTEGSKLSPGLQGSLHVQHWRLCLIGEPSAGCKFICSWRLDAIEHAHTMTTTGNSAISFGTTSATDGSAGLISSSLSGSGATNGPLGSRSSFTNDLNPITMPHHRVSLGNLSVLSGSGPSAGSINVNHSSRSGGTGTPAALLMRPRHVLILEANNSAGKGRGTHTFELDGGSLPKLTSAIEQLMALRYNPHGIVTRTPSQSQTTNYLPLQPGSTETAMVVDQVKDTTFISDLGHSKEVGLVSSSYSSDASGSRHSISPAQRFSLIKSGEPNLSSPRRQSPLTIPTSSTGMAATSQHQPHVYGQSVPVTASARCHYYNLSHPYSNLVSSSSSLSPPESLPGELRKHSDAPSLARWAKPKRFGRRSIPNHTDPSRSMEPTSSMMQFAHHSGDCLLARSASPQEGGGLIIDDLELHSAHTIFTGSRGNGTTSSFPQSLHTTTTWSHSASGLSGTTVTNSSTVGRSGEKSGDFLDGTLLLGEEHQPNVAHVASGVIISKNPLNPHPNRSSIGGGAIKRASTGPLLPPPLPDSARARQESRTPLYHNPSTTVSSSVMPQPSGARDTGSEGSNVMTQNSHPRSCRRHKFGGSYLHEHQHICRRTMPRATDTSVASSTGVFTADEDLWDTDERTQPLAEHFSPASSALGRSEFTVPVDELNVPHQNRCSVLQDSKVQPAWSMSGDPRVPPTDSTSFAPSPSKCSSTNGVRAAWTAQQCNCNPKFREVLKRRDYNVYRHRCRQYRICNCSLFQTRSLSSDASLVLQAGVQQRHYSQHPAYPPGVRLDCGANCWDECELYRDTNTKGVDFIADGSFDVTADQSTRTNMDTLPGTITQPNTNRKSKRRLTATPSIGGRTKPLHWLFHRKHSKSHDNLPSHYASHDNAESSEHPISVSATENDLMLRHPNARRSFSDVPAPPAQYCLHGMLPFTDMMHIQLLYRCSRHGMQPYQPWTTMTPYSLYSRCPCVYRRKRTLRLRPPTARAITCLSKHSRRCIFRQPSAHGAICPHLVMSSVKQLFQPRVRKRDPKESTVLSSERLEPSSATMTSSRTRSEVRQTEVSGERIAILEQKSHSGDRQILVNHPTTAHPSLPKLNRWLCELHSRSLQSIVLACSEPSVTRSTWPWSRRTRSHHSSQSSLLTCRSCSASSSLSARHQIPSSADHTSQRKRNGTGAQASCIPGETVTETHGSIDLLAETRSCSLCDTDDLSSSSICDECYLVPESQYRPDASSTYGLYHPHHIFYVDCCSPFRNGGLSTGSRFDSHSTDPDQGMSLHSTRTSQSNALPKLSGADRRTLSLCNPGEIVATGSLQPPTLTRPNGPCRLDKLYPHPNMRDLLTSYTQRASTLPNTKISHRNSSHRGHHCVAPNQHNCVKEAELEEAEDDLFDGLIHRTVDSQFINLPAFLNVPINSVRIDRLLHRASVSATGSGRRFLRYNTITASSNGLLNNVGSTAAPVTVTGGHGSSGTSSSRKLSSQSDACVSHHFLDDGIAKSLANDRLGTEGSTYCNLTSAGQQGPSPDIMPSTELPLGKAPSSSLSPINLEHTSGTEPSSGRYVNLPSNRSGPTSATSVSPQTTTTTSVAAPLTTNSLAARFKHLVQSLHPSMVTSANPTGFCSDSRPLSKAIDFTGLTSVGRSKGRSAQMSLDSFNGPNSTPTGSSRCGQHSAIGAGLDSDLFTVPAEVRDPSRNYAIVDLRPSPASSVIANTEISLGSGSHHLPTSCIEEITSGSSAVSMLGFSTSTSTGSDCTSDAATLTSDTMDGYAPLVSTNATNPPRPHTRAPETTEPPARTGSEFSRRRHSHSLSSAISDPPVLNYVHVIAATAPLSTPNSARRDGCCTVSEPIVCSIPEQTDSHSSSSGLGGIASHSITPPAPTSSASFGDIFTSRSMTSSATSGEGGNVILDAGFQSCSSPDAVAYTLIDFNRTMALGELSGDMIEQQQQSEQQQGITALTKTSGTNSHFKWPQQHKAAVDRSTSVRKSLSRSIRSIRRGNLKKSSIFMNNNA